MNNKKIFSHYYNINFWKKEESLSGLGLNTISTHQLIKELSILFKKTNIRTILDASCGDFSWIKNIDLSNIKYHGIDIVEDLIK